MAKKSAQVIEKQGVDSPNEAPLEPIETSNAPKEPKKPSLDQILARAKADKERWEKRNERMERHERLYSLERPVTKAGEVVVVLNDPRVVTQKVAQTLARRKKRIMVAARGEENRVPAQRIENTLRWYEGYAGHKWQDGLHPPFDFDIALTLTLRGIVAERITYDKDSKVGISEKIIDPYHIYPKLGSDRIERVCHIYKTSAGTVKEEFPESKYVADLDDDTEVTVTGYYENRPPYFHAIIVDNQFVKEPVGLDYWPWVIRLAKSGVGQTPIGSRTEKEALAEIGQGFLDCIEDTVRDMNRYVTVMASAAAKMENPPKVVFSVNGQTNEVDIETGGTTTLAVGENVQLLEIGPKIGQLMPLLTTFQDRLNKGTLPASLFGSGAGAESGFDRALMLGAAEDTLRMFSVALESFHAARFSKILEIFERLGPDSVEIVSVKKKARLWGTGMTVADVKANGTFVEVVYPDSTPQDRAAMANIAIALTDKKIWSLLRAREMTEVDDPEGENRQILREMIYLDPDMIKRLAEIHWEELENSPELQMLMKIKREKAEAEKAARMAAGMGMPGATNMPAGGVPTGGSPMGNLPTGGMPSSTLPPAEAGLQPDATGAMDLINQIATGGL